MAKDQKDFKKEWEKAREQFTKLSKDAMEMAKKGEKEFAKLSRWGKLQVDATAINLKREQLYYLIGKEYVRAKVPEKPTGALAKLLGELKRAQRDERAVRVKLAKANKPSTR